MSQSPSKILLVDDDITILSISKEYLDVTGEFIVDVAASGEDALIKIKENNYDLIISDLIMDGIGGLDLLKQVSESSDVLFILISSFESAEQESSFAREFFSYNATGILEKPYRLDLLIYLIRHVLKCETEDATIEFHKAAARFFSKIGSYYEKNRVLNNLGIVYNLRGKKDKARECFEQTLFPYRTSDL